MSTYPDFITPQAAGGLYGLLQERVRRTPEREAYRCFSRETESWESISWREVLEKVRCWKAALKMEDMRPGDRVAVMLGNCLEWVLFDQAALALGSVVVPLYMNDRPENSSFILKETQARLLLVESQEQWLKIEEVGGPFEHLARVVTRQSMEAEGRDSLAICLDNWLPEQAEDVLDHECVADELATIVYTSGTTGPPKGVMLSHANILSNCHATLQKIAVYPHDLFLSFLPLSHMFERTAGYYIPIMSGARVAFARSIQHLSVDLKTVKPTILISVPRIFESIYAKIQSRLKRRSSVERLLLTFAVKVGWHQFQYSQSQTSWHVSLLLWSVLKRLVADKVTNRLGGRLRLAVSGGAPLFPSLAQFFIGLGVPIIQGYGLTETSPIVSFNFPDDNVPSSVGYPLSGVETKTTEDGELLVRGENVMLGYWGNQAATAAAIDSDLWFYTGDKVEIDVSGRIFITGRLKEIIVLLTGEKVPPEDLEMAIAMDPLFDQVLIVGDGRSFLSAITVLNEENWKDWMLSMEWDAEDKTMVGNREVQSLLLRKIAERLSPFPGYERVRRILPSFVPWEVRDGLITPTLKPCRKKIEALFDQEIEALYE